MNLEELKLNLSELPLDMSGHTISNLTHELNDLVRAGGKKFRPGLLFLMGEVFGLSRDELTTYARAVELTHLASLVHDDVIDESPSRRNHPTLNHLRNNTTAILAGDYLLASIMGELAAKNNNEILIDLTKSIQDLADGEWLQYDLKKKAEVLFEDLELISVKKTGSLIRWCCTTPAKLANYADVASMKLLGERVGVIFQMADDIVDGLNHGGRPPFQDITNGQFNFVTLKLMDLYPELKDSLYKFKADASGSMPWTEVQYHEAIRAVDAVIVQEINQAVSIFKDVSKKQNKEDLVFIFELMIGKIKSNYDSFFTL